MSTQEQRERFEVWARSENYPLGYDGPNGSDYIDAATSCAYMGWQAAEAAAIKRCAELIEGMNDSAGDRASYDNREMHEGEVERMNALSDASNAIRALLPKEGS